MKPSNGLNISRSAILFTAGAILWCIVALALIYVFPRFTDSLNFKLYDWKLSLSPNTERSSKIVHLDVDDVAITKYGQWPWDRTMSARIVDRLSQLGAKTVVFDILYSGKGKSIEGDEAFFKSIKKARNVVSATMVGTDPHRKMSDNDYDKSRADALHERSWVIKAPDSTELPKVTELRNSFLPLMPVIRNSAGLGHIKGVPDPDGVYRRIPILVRLENRYVPSLSLSAVQNYLDLDSKDFSIGTGGEILVRHKDNSLRIPLDEKGMMLVRWGRIWDKELEEKLAVFPHHSAFDILSDKEDVTRESRYKDKIVIVGVITTGTTDLGATPLAVKVPLGRIHSFALNMLLSGDFITPIKATPYILGLGIILAILFPIVTARASLRVVIIIAIVIFIGSFVASIGLFINSSYEVPIGEFLTLVAPCMAGIIVIRTFAIEMKEAQTTKALERYLSPDLVWQLRRSGKELDLTSKRKELSIVFVDIEGFSSTCETVDVEYINQFLNHFFELMVGAIFQHNGTIDKFLGDGLLAFFGDPAPIENSALSAVNASLEMQKRMKELNAHWSQSGIPEFEMGVRIRIGINTGPVVVGNIGFSKRVEYTVLGSVVNVASRLQSLAPPGGIIMTARTYALVKDQVECQGPDPVRVKGIDRDIDTYKIYSESI